MSDPIPTPEPSPVFEVCRRCHGVGKAWTELGWSTCPFCGGVGAVEVATEP